MTQDDWGIFFGIAGLVVGAASLVFSALAAIRSKEATKVAREIQDDVNGRLRFAAASKTLDDLASVVSPDDTPNTVIPQLGQRLLQTKAAIGVLSDLSPDEKKARDRLAKMIDDARPAGGRLSRDDRARLYDAVQVLQATFAPIQASDRRIRLPW